MDNDMSKNGQMETLEAMSFEQGQKVLQAAELLYQKMEEQAENVAASFGRSGWTDGEEGFHLRMSGRELDTLLELVDASFPVKIDDALYVIKGIRWNTVVKAYDMVLNRFR